MLIHLPMHLTCSPRVQLSFGSGSSILRQHSSGVLTEDEFEKLHIPTYADDKGGKRRLRVFMPADNPALNLCKTIMSGVALGYPLPTILNWHGEFNHPEWHFSGSHIAKLESLLSVINTLLNDHPDDAHEDDIALLVDAYDIWFQLPPSVLIERFHQLNREADARNMEAWKSLGPGFPVPPPRQSIIVTAAKDCFPDWTSGSEPHYEHWPESPMPLDFYGKDTDQEPWFADPARKYSRVRPRCVNSGLIIGTMGALRDALQRAQDKVDEVTRNGRQLWSDQALFAEVIGDQELWREWMRGLAQTWNGTASTSDLSRLKPAVWNIAKAAGNDKKRFEFGIGLDYNFTTIPPTCSSEEDGSFVRMDDREGIERESRKAGVPDGVRVKGVPAELVGQEAPVPGKKWDELSLYTDFWFGTSPVGIHHNAYINGLKTYRLKHWWSLTWFYPHLRYLVTRNLKPETGEARPLATVSSKSQGRQDIRYFAPSSSGEERLVEVYEPSKKFSKLSWDGVCQNGPKPWHEDLFGDGKGPMEI